MYKHCTTETGEQRQRQFEGCLLELMGQKPYRQISVSDLCGRMGLSRKAFYRYFSSLDDCLTALVDHTIMELLSSDLQPGAEGAAQCFAYWQDRGELLEALCRNGLTELLLTRSGVCAAQAPDSRLLARADKPEQLTFLVCGFVGMLLQWHLEGCRQSPAQLAEALTALFR